MLYAGAQAAGIPSCATISADVFPATVVVPVILDIPVPVCGVPYAPE